MNNKYKMFDMVLSFIQVWDFGYERRYKVGYGAVTRKKYKILRMAEIEGFDEMLDYLKEKLEEVLETLDKLDNIGVMEQTERYYIETAKKQAFREVMDVIENRNEKIKNFKWYKKYN